MGRLRSNHVHIRVVNVDAKVTRGWGFNCPKHLRVLFR